MLFLFDNLLFFKIRKHRKKQIVYQIVWFYDRFFCRIFLQWFYIFQPASIIKDWHLLVFIHLSAPYLIFTV